MKSALAEKSAPGTSTSPPFASTSEPPAARRARPAWTDRWPGLLFLVAVDALAALGAFALGYLLRFEWRLWPQPQVPKPSLEDYVLSWAAMGTILIACAWTSGLYARKRVRDAGDVLPPLARALSCALLGSLAIGYLYRDFDYSRLALVYSAVVALLLLGAFRVSWERYRRRLRSLGCGVKNIVLVGSRSIPQYLAAKFREDPAYGYRIAGVADQGVIDAASFGGVPTARLEETARLAHEVDAEEVLVAHPALGHHQLLAIIQQCEQAAIPIRVVPATYDLLIDLADFETVGGLPLVRVNERRHVPVYAVVKRACDIAGSALLLLASAPFLLAACAAIRLDSPGPAIFHQRRVGRDGRVFRMLKLRTMVRDADQRLAEVVDVERLAEPVFKLAHDPRVTRIGRFLRRYGLDELPQLVNVLRGEMSLVGPRPEEERMVARYDVWERRRLKAAPGMTGLQQVQCRGTNSLEERVHWDILYLRKQSALLDLWILTKTIAVVCRGQECSRPGASVPSTKDGAAG